MSYRYHLSVFLFLLMLPLFAQEHIFTGACPFSQISPQEARQRAIRQARLTAIEQQCGINLQSEAMVKDFMLSGDFIHSVSFGQIVSEKMVEETVQVEQRASDQPPHLIYRVKMDIRVDCESGKPDPAFRLKLTSNKKTFVRGEELILTVRSTRDCYLTVVNYAADGKVYLLMPGTLLQDNFLKAGEKMEIPHAAQRANGIHLSMATLPGSSSSSEVIQVIATRRKIEFLDELQEEQGFGVLPNITIAGQQLARWLANIPVAERAMAQMVVAVHRE